MTAPSFSKTGLVCILLAALALALTIALPAQAQARRLRDLEAALNGPKPVPVMDALGELAGMDDPAARRLVLRALATSRDPAVVDCARDLLLLRNGMMANSARPHYETGKVPPILDLARGEMVFVFDGPIPERVKETLRREAASRFAMPIREMVCPWDFSAASVPLRSQYDMELMLGAVISHLGTTQGRCVLVTDRDTYYPGRNWDTGVSTAFGPVSILSVRRLDPVFFGGRPNDSTLCERVRKVFIHELGHTYLPTNRHCPNWDCVVHATQSMADIDRLTDHYCEPCGAIIARTVRDVAEGFPLEPPH
ncbi:MAG: hypothetical protein HYY93_06440 [Planctomycetes bacterium]|nr:hypothetical protein [Planctomycetota bacterium]